MFEWHFDGRPPSKRSKIHDDGGIKVSGIVKFRGAEKALCSGCTAGLDSGANEEVCW